MTCNGYVSHVGYIESPLLFYYITWLVTYNTLYCFVGVFSVQQQDLKEGRTAAVKTANRARQLYKNISMLFLFPVKDGKLSTGVIAIFNASCYG